jgi:hypothetical protein
MFPFEQEKLTCVKPNFALPITLLNDLRLLKNAFTAYDADQMMSFCGFIQGGNHCLGHRTPAGLGWFEKCCFDCRQTHETLC